ncbi:MAG: hypothetical protein GY718_04405 [Lentisphaerae bacterium]|nr:hypothetical protein [Lentisphaerota bacterium]
MEQPASATKTDNSKKISNLELNILNTIAAFFIAIGCLSLASMISLFFNEVFYLDFNILLILLGYGLLKRTYAAYSITKVLVLIFISIVLISIFLKFTSLSYITLTILFSLLILFCATSYFLRLKSLKEYFRFGSVQTSNIFIPVLAVSLILSFTLTFLTSYICNTYIKQL